LEAQQNNNGTTKVTKATVSCLITLFLLLLAFAIGSNWVMKAYAFVGFVSGITLTLIRRYRAIGIKILIPFTVVAMILLYFSVLLII
jgi:hypothetical protein